MKKTVLFVLLLISCACSTKEKVKENNYELINLAGAFTQLEELSVKDLAEHISYIPLETTEESLIGNRAYVRILKDKILVGSYQQPIKMFDKTTGKFIRTVGNIGQGANEYTLDSNMPVFWIDDAGGIIYIKTAGSILRFDENGNPLSSVSLPENFPAIEGLSQIVTEDKLYAYLQTSLGKNEYEYKVFMYDIYNGEIKKYFLDEDEIIPLDSYNSLYIFSEFKNIPVSTGFLFFSLKDGRIIFNLKENPCLWAFDRNVYFKENFNDTIYQISENEMTPRLVFNLGDRHWPYQDRFKKEGNQNKIAIDYILEGKDVLFFVFQTNYYHGQDGKTYWGVYNKRDKSVKVTDKLQIKDPAHGIFNGKLHSATSDGQLAGLVDAFSFMESMNGGNGFDISEENNPVVVIIE